MAKPATLVTIDDVWESSNLNIIEIEEGKESPVDGTHIIGRIVGECFFPNKTSRNNRYYSRDLWEAVLKDEELVERLNNRSVYGTVGHEQPVDDKAILEGKISHIVSKLWLDDKNCGMGEFLILGTPAGKNLYTILKAGGKIYFSTRAAGKFEREKSNILSPDGFKLFTVDFVTSPGFLEASPTIIEAKESQNKGLNNMEQFTEDFVNHLKTEHVAIKEERNSLLTQYNQAVKELANSNATLAQYEGLGSPEFLANCVSGYEQNKDKSELIKEYIRLGTPAEILEALEKSRKVGESYKMISNELGTPTEIREVLSATESYINETKATIENLNSKIEKYQELGSVSEIREALESVHQKIIYEMGEGNSTNKRIAEFEEEYGSLIEAARVIDKVEEFVDEFGTFDEIKAILEFTDKNLNKIQRYPLLREKLKIVEDFTNIYGDLREIAYVLEETNQFVHKNGDFDTISTILEVTDGFTESYGNYSEIAYVLEEADRFIDENGNFSMVAEALEKAEDKISHINEEHKRIQNISLAKKLGAKPTTIEKLNESGLSQSEIAEIFQNENLGEVKAAMNSAKYLMSQQSREVIPQPTNSTNESLVGRLMNNA